MNINIVNAAITQRLFWAYLTNRILYKLKLKRNLHHVVEQCIWVYLYKSPDGNPSSTSQKDQALRLFNLCRWHTLQKPAPLYWLHFLAPVSGTRVMLWKSGTRFVWYTRFRRRLEQCSVPSQKVASCTWIRNTAQKYIINIVHKSKFILSVQQSWTGHCATLPWHRHPFGLWYLTNGAPKLLLMAQPLKHPSPSLMSSAMHSAGQNNL